MVTACLNGFLAAVPVGFTAAEALLPETTLIWEVAPELPAHLKGYA